MKIDIIEPPIPKPPTYPMLKKCISYNFLVLFDTERAGTVVNAGSGPYRVGYHCGDWDPAKYIPFTGSITLQND